MDLKEYVRVLTRQWLWIVGAVAIALGLALAYLTTAPVTYSARSELFLSTQNGAGGTLLDLSRYSEQRAKSYVQIVDTPAVLEPVIDDLGLEESVAELGQSVQASAPLETVLLILEVTREDQDEAVRIADALSESVLTLINDLEVGEAPVAGDPAVGLTATILTRAEPNPWPTSPDRRIILAAAMVLGLGAGLALALSRHVKDVVVRSQDDVRRAVTQAVSSAALGPVRLDGETAPRVSFLDAGAVATYLSARDEPQLLVYVLHAGEMRGLPQALVEAAASLTGAAGPVCVVDTDADGQALSKWAGAGSAPGWSDVVGRDATVEQVSTEHGESSLSLVYSGEPVDSVNQARSALAVQEVNSRYARSIFMIRYDGKGAPPQALGRADVVIVWVEPGVSSRVHLVAQLQLAFAAQAGDVVVVSATGGRRSRSRKGQR